MIVPLIVGVVLGATGALGLARVLGRPPWARPTGFGPAERADRAATGAADPQQPPEERPAREALRGALAEVVARLGARRAILWDVEAIHELARAAIVTSGEHPADLGLRGDPVGFALREKQPLRLPTSQRWSRGGNGCAIPLRETGPSALLTLEFAVEADLPGPDDLALWGAYLEAFVDAETFQSRTAHERARTDMLLELLRELPRADNEGDFAGALAEAARRLAGVDGAAVARWDGERGEVVAVAPAGSAPAIGSRFGLRQSVAGLVPIRQETVARDRRREETVRLPVLAPGERWPAEPRAAAAFPLLGREGEVIAIVAIWTIGESVIDERARKPVETIASYAALHLRQILAYAGARRESRFDPLTELPNRRAFEERFAEEVQRCGRYERPLALLMLDVDHFKQINDTHGHDAGDAVLAALGRILRGALRGTDLPARLGGEEFVAILPETTLAAAAETAERLRARIEAMPVAWHGDEIAVTASFGVAASPECLADPTGLLEAADGALYAAKAAGRNRVCSAAPVRR